jgi:hypothetical protein
MSEQQNKRDALTQIIIADVDDRFAWGRINHIIDLTLSILTVLAS